MKKRTIISIIILLAVSNLIVTTFDSCNKAPHKNIGLQLYSIRDSITKDVPGAIAKVAKMGYTFVEPAGYGNGKFYDMEPADFKALCEKNKLAILSSHTGQALPDSANWGKTMAWWDECIAAHAVLGVKYIIQPFMGREAFQSLDTMKRYCDYFNLIGEKCNAKGIRF
ncbi:MAG: TIM barrel protein, partial [Bacteroidia bacterium]|nr:TIM barrel protein [Bacteroidia bacterium]